MSEFKPKQTVALRSASLQGEMYKVKITEIVNHCAMVSGYRPMIVPLPLDALCTIAEAKRNIAAFKKSQKPAHEETKSPENVMGMPVVHLSRVRFSGT